MLKLKHNNGQSNLAKGRETTQAINSGGKEGIHNQSKELASKH